LKSSKPITSFVAFNQLVATYFSNEVEPRQRAQGLKYRGITFIWLVEFRKSNLRWRMEMHCEFLKSLNHCKTPTLTYSWWSH